MTVYDLEKQATPGPVHTDDGYMYNKDGDMVAQAGPDGNGYDLDLLAHCRNHFMKALEALKLAEKTLMSMCGPEVYQATHRSWPIGQVREAIKELEEVKT